MRAAGDFLKIFGPAVLVAVGGFVVAYQYVDPAPPDRFVLATASSDGAYHRHGERYREILARHDITVELLQTAGSVENLRLLHEGAAQVAFVQGGTASPADGGELEALASLYFEPLWVFLRDGVQAGRLSELAGHRVAVGPHGSGTRAIAVEVLRANGIDPASPGISDLAGRAAAAALLAGELDAVFLVSGIDAPAVTSLLTAEGVRLISFTRADAYTRRFRHLSSVTLPEGAIDLARDRPARDVTLIAPTANLMARKDIHPALVDLLMAAADEVHGAGGMFASHGQFPSPKYVDLPLSKEAERYFESGPSFLRRVLPFWAATLVERLAVMIVPLVALLFPLIRITPPVYRWRIRSRIYRWYRELLAIDPTVHGDGAEPRLRKGLEDISRIEREVAHVEVPLSYADQLYALRVHIELVRDKLNAALGAQR